MILNIKEEDGRTWCHYGVVRHQGMVVEDSAIGVGKILVREILDFER